MRKRYRIFIGSPGTNASLEIVSELYNLLHNDYDVKAWTQDDVIPVGESLRQSLVDEAMRCDCAIFIFMPDDIEKMAIAGKRQVPRSNVVYELGLFSGLIAPNRCFSIVPSDVYVEKPSDLGGIKDLKFEYETFLENRHLSLRPVVGAITAAMLALDGTKEMERATRERRDRLQRELEQKCRTLAFPLQPNDIGLRASVFRPDDGHNLVLEAIWSADGDAPEQVDHLTLGDPGHEDYAVVRAFRQRRISKYLVEAIPPELDGSVHEDLKYIVAAPIYRHLNGRSEVAGVLAYDALSESGANFLSKLTVDDDLIDRIRRRTASEISRIMEGVLMIHSRSCVHHVKDGRL